MVIVVFKTDSKYHIHNLAIIVRNRLSETEFPSCYYRIERSVIYTTQFQYIILSEPWNPVYLTLDIHLFIRKYDDYQIMTATGLFLFISLFNVYVLNYYFVCLFILYRFLYRCLFMSG